MESPYEYEEVDELDYRFTTDSALEYRASFADGSGYFLQSIPNATWIKAFGFQIVGYHPDRIPHDPRVGETISKIILQYFEQNPDGALFFIHDGSDGKALGRKKKFDVWYRKVAQDRFRKENAVIRVGRIEVHTSILFRQGHPLEADLIGAFESVGAAANEKPEALD